MKPFIAILTLAILICSCEKEIEPTCSDGELNQGETYADCGGPCTPCPITYPENGNLGTNLLFGDQDTMTLVSSNYSLKCDVPTGSSFKVVITTVSGDYWFYGTNEGWDISPLSNFQIFEVIAAGTANLTLNLVNSNGSAVLEYYENSEAATKSKVIIWG